MRPLKLCFKGINSFSDYTVIDFEKLIKRGIFGIFGDTGSGKSTILDCINFALYGRVERSREKLDIINYRSEAAEVKFDFDVLSEGKRKVYSIERTIKRKSGVHKASLFEDGVCIADNASTVTKKITDIIGVDAEDFRKCIALPQGEFSQFVKSQPSERISLIERLFSLSKYGDRLKEKLKTCGDEAAIAYRTTDAKLQTYSDVSNEIIESRSKEISKTEKEIASLSKSVEKSEKSFSALRSLNESRKERDAILVKLSEAECVKQRMEDLRTRLNCLPVCKTVVEISDEIKAKLQERLQAEKSLTELTEKIKLSEQRLEQYNNKLKSDNYDEKIAVCIELAAKYKACEDKPYKLERLEKQLEAKRMEFRKKDEELRVLSALTEDRKKEATAIEKELSLCGAEDLEKLINIDFKGAVLKEEYVNSLDYFVGLNGNVKLFGNDNPLYDYVTEELKNRIDFYKDRIYQVKDFNLKEAESSLKNFQASDSRRKKLTEEFNAVVARLKDAEAAVKQCEREKELLKSEGENLKSSYDEIKNEICKIFGADIKDFSSAVNENNAARAGFEKAKRKLNDDINACQKDLSELRSLLSAAEAKLKAADSETENLERKLKDLIIKSGLKDAESCKKLAEEFSAYPDAESALRKFDAEFISLNSRLAQLNAIPGIAEFSKDEFLRVEKEKDILSENLSALKEKLAVLKNNYNTAQTRLAEKQELLKQFAVEEKRNNLIGQLKDLTKGNKFMEFIANEYLYDISSLASTTLLNLTDGRYFLTYTDTFYAGDNFDCGNLRGVNTLSGGETFLVSLSLALALSQTICASLKSIEFFFLDEGFGTLDGSLVDTVMNALEKLKSSHFMIGVISHVEELKHRIDSKITVNKATESHGSTVQISC